MKVMKRITLAVAAIAMTSATVQAQHSYLPATAIGGDGKIETFVDGLPDRVVTNTFSSELADNVWRAGGPSAFLKDTGDSDIPAGFDTLSPNTDLSITVPVLSDSNFDGTGNLLYWDMTGPMVFGTARPTPPCRSAARMAGSLCQKPRLTAAPRP